MDYFAGLDISMDETHICVATAKALLSTRVSRRRQRRRSLTSYRKRRVAIGSSSRLDAWRRSCSMG
jgi:hypothetical protein